MGIDFEGLKSVANGSNVDQAATFAKSRFGEHADKIDAVADKAKQYLDGRPEGEHLSEDDASAGNEFGRQQEDGYGRHAWRGSDDSPTVSEYGGEVTPAGGHDDRGGADECGEISYGSTDSERGLDG